MANVIVRDRGWNRIKSRYRQLNGHGVKIGLFDGDLAEVGYHNEYGTNIAPSRPFTRRTFTANRAEAQKRMHAAATDVVVDDQSMVAALASVGEWYKERIVDMIRNSPGWAKPNSAYTVALKGHDHPLVDSGDMVAAITFKVE